MFKQFPGAALHLVLVEQAVFLEKFGSEKDVVVDGQILDEVELLRNQAYPKTSGIDGIQNFDGFTSDTR